MYPTPLTSLIGRDGDLERLAAMLSDPASRLVSLTGSGGVGKTRLAIAASERLGDEIDAVTFVPLSTLDEAGLVAQAIARAFGIAESESGSLIDLLAAELASGRRLLILDNFEQVIDAALIVPRLLTAAPSLTVLVTSRERLRVSGEREFPVQPLGLPTLRERDQLDAAQIAATPAVQLFVDRARAARPDITLTNRTAADVAEICLRLDGLPLAIELAAARIRIMPPAAMLTRLENQLAFLVGGPRDLEARQQTLRGAVAWSHDLLDPQEQAAFRRLAVPAGSFSLETAEVLVAAFDDLDESEVFGYLESLLDKSLIRQVDDAGGDLRFEMLETIRAFGLEEAATHDELERLRAVHAGHVAGYIEVWAADLTGEQQRDAMAALDQEYDSIRGALEWAVVQDRPEIAMRLGVSLWRYWTSRGLLSEGFGWLMSILAMSGIDAGPGPLRAALYDGAGAVAYLMGDRRTAEQHYRKALDLLDPHSDPAEIVRVFNHLAMAVQDQGEHEEAARLLEEALERSREVDDPRLIGMSLYNLSYLAGERGDYRRAMSLVSESQPYFQQIGDDQSSADLLSTLGYLAYALGDLDQALDLCQRSLAGFEAIDDRYGMGEAYGDLGLVHEALMDSEAALDALERSIEIGAETGNNRRAAESKLALGRLAAASGDQARTRSLYEEALAMNRDLEYRLGVAVALAHCAAADLAASNVVAAEQHIRECLEISRQLDFRPVIAVGLAGFAAVRAVGGQPREAAGFLQSAGQSRANPAIILMPYEEALYRQFEAAYHERASGVPVTASPATPGVATPAAPAEPRQAADQFGITARELEVIGLLVEGLSNPEIADRLFITRRTATTHVSNIMNKLGLNSRTAVAALAVREGIV